MAAGMRAAWRRLPPPSRAARPPSPPPPLQVLQAAEADAASRLARLQTLRAVEPGDWWAALHHAASRLPAGRVAQRLFERIRLLPLSHHHRFPLYEQVRRGVGSTERFQPGACDVLAAAHAHGHRRHR